LGLISSRKLLTEKVIIAKLNRESFETKIMVSCFPFLNVHWISNYPEGLPSFGIGASACTTLLNAFFFFRRLHSFLENDYIADFGWLDFVAIGV
jgi:hypothetical protein